jgi:integration host factor subunit alpha
MSLNRTYIEKWIKFEFYFSGAKCKKIVNTLIEILMRTLESGEDILISGFGKFCVKEKAERKGRDPTTGESIILPPRRVVTFKCSPTLREKIERTHYPSTFGVNPQEIFQLFDFVNKITPPNWIFYEYGNPPALKPGNLYIEVFPINSDVIDWEEEEEPIGFVSGPMMF